MSLANDFYDIVGTRIAVESLCPGDVFILEEGPKRTFMKVTHKHHDGTECPPQATGFVIVKEET